MSKGLAANQTMSVQDLPRDSILAIAAKHGAENVRVFGSFARGEAGPDSDLDLLIEVGQATSSWFPAGLVIDLEELLDRQVGVSFEDSLHWLVKERILAESVSI